jgi:hypothetical protein
VTDVICNLDDLICDVDNIICDVDKYFVTKFFDVYEELLLLLLTASRCKWLGDVMGYQSPPEATATLGLTTSLLPKNYCRIPPTSSISGTSAKSPRDA